MCDKENIIFGGEGMIDFSRSFTTLGEFIYFHLSKNQDKNGMIDGITGRKTSYSEIKEKALSLAEFLRQIGIKEGDVIGICSENRIEFTITMYSAFFVGAAIVGMNYLYKEGELIHTFQMTQPKIIFCSQFATEKVLNTSKKFPFIENVIQYGGTALVDGIYAFDNILKDKKYAKTEKEFVCPSKDLNRTAVILLSSGTTGLAKGVEVTERNLMASLGIFNEFWKTLYNERELTSINCTPWFQTLGFHSQITCLVENFTLIFLPRFEERPFLNCIEKYKVTHPIMVPSMALFLAKSPLVMEYDLSSLEELICGGAPLSKELEDNVNSRISNLQGIRQGFGLSETTLMVTISCDSETKKGSVGTVTKGTYCKVVNSETGKNLGPNEIGELYFKGPQIMKGYIGNDAATKETIDSEGWLRTGDLGYYDDDKYFFIVDRIKEVIKFRACQVPPAELEALLLAHPKIADAGVTGIPNEADGEHPMAFVVKKPNVEVTEQEIKDYIEEIVTDIKKLRGGVKFVNQIPKNATGKILRRELKKLIKSL
ncbi:uncharacterized protein LOC129800044 [Phlebotomus papatasi]|uniref:uncharacterized protein LOC129800044 n=1 Tax=Phlebotomus papatasi TaxID=29031 RepID=UPI0024833A25|nr:uncharacterized protein LOC129800044 [Phlebotomus papatasi]